MVPLTQPETYASWKARLEIDIVASADGTRLGRRLHRGPLRIQRPFYPEGPNVLHLYLLHPPGGVVGGDQLEICLNLDPRTHAVITTPSAQKLYRSSGAVSQIETDLSLRPGACLEWLPTETIIYDGARAHSAHRVRLETGATYIGWEMACFGRPASRSGFDEGEVTLSFELDYERRPRLIECSRVAGGSDLLSAPWGYAACAAFGTLVCAASDAERLQRATRVLDELSSQLRDAQAGVTQLDGVSVFRVRAHSLQAVRAALVRAWTSIRPMIVGRPAHEPRIWST